MKKLLTAIGGLTLALGLASCSTTREIVPLGSMAPAALQTAKTIVVFVVDRDALRVQVHGKVDWWATTIGQGLIFFPLIGPIRYPEDVGYEAQIQPLREPHLADWRAHYVRMLEKSVHLPAATSMVFRIVSPDELRQDIFPAQFQADLYVDCTPRFLMGSSYWQWAQPKAMLAAITGPIVIEPAVVARVSRELAKMYEERPSHRTVGTSRLWQAGKYPFEGCYREYTALLSPPHKKKRWLEQDGRLLDQETRQLLKRLATEVNYTLNARVGALETVRAK
ncbi:MAG: hypothetical protein NTV49_07045 [Kiritimatiellaeota bacterium]|nr:hypothetical protein [Kiritimatiellota bacterium]